MSDEHNLLLIISRVRDILELWFSQWACMSIGQTKVAERPHVRQVEGAKNVKNEHSFEKMNIIFDNF